MKRLILTAGIAIFFRLYSDGQNLVLNPDLESYIICPAFGQFSNTFIDNWDKPSYGSTDYYNYNCPGIVPTQQVPRSGDAYAGIIGYNYSQEYREYMTGMLSAPLTPGVYYCEFYVSLNDGYIQAIKEIGAYFSAAPPGPYLNSLHIPVTPQVKNTVTLLDDTSGWMKISGYLYSAGGEQYITIGNFNDDANTTIVQVGNSGSYGSYYFVDDVSLSPAKENAVSENSEIGIQIFPNPVVSTISISISQNTKCTFSVYNTLGEKVVDLGTQLTGPNATIDVRTLPFGIYFLKIKTEDRVFMKKFVKA